MTDAQNHRVQAVVPVHVHEVKTEAKKAEPEATTAAAKPAGKPISPKK